jgi:hypothetical protein
MLHPSSSSRLVLVVILSMLLLLLLLRTFPHTIFTPTNGLKSHALGNHEKNHSKTTHVVLATITANAAAKFLLIPPQPFSYLSSRFLFLFSLGKFDKRQQTNSLQSYFIIKAFTSFIL